MDRTQRGCLVLTVTTTMLLVAPAFSAEKPTAIVINPLLSLAGRNSGVSEQKLLRVTTKEQWCALWNEHKVGSTHPKELPEDYEFIDLDFERVMVLAVFEGESVNCRGFSVHSILEDAAQITVRVEAWLYQSGVDTPKTQAWGLFVVPRSHKRLVLERDVRGEIESPPKWEEWTVFPAISAK